MLGDCLACGNVLLQCSIAVFQLKSLFLQLADQGLTVFLEQFLLILGRILGARRQRRRAAGSNGVQPSQELVRLGGLEDECIGAEAERQSFVFRFRVRRRVDDELAWL
ncbi:MAG: hypothetical protein WDO74_32015 [Pseudomonadota bacterium]